ncbi:NGF domain-containing protein [Aphelenchoides besseyi]|nr:NGF domain-containing protein [Aphelenchoides besseyi]KAI6237623.1 NGF domain-containing protein [Aphelenchoides besseyi]
MHLNTPLNFSLLVLCSFAMFTSVHSYYVLARYDTDSLMKRLVDSLRDSYTETDEPMDVGNNMMSRERRRAEVKRSASNIKPLPAHEDVCEMKIRQNYQPKFGHEQNGTRVEIQQDDQREFRVTFVECEESRTSCNGIDDGFTSECITVYGLHAAGIRPEGSSGPFSDGLIKVPIACNCRIRRKLGLIMPEI